MGIAVAVIYLPIFIFCAIVSIYAGGKICNFDSPFEKTNGLALLQLFVLFLGMIVPMIICIFVMWLIPIKNNPSWDGFIENLAISLFGPLSIGFFVFMISLMARSKLKAILRYFSAGAFFSVPFFPVVAFMFFSALSKST